MTHQNGAAANRQKIIIYILLTIVTLAVYWQVRQFDFINFDDNLYITDNPIIQSGITFDGLRWAFTTKYFGLWNPLAWVSFMLDYQLFGLNAGGYHLTNLILHILSSLLLFWLFCRMTGAVWKSAFVAGLFALHPLHVESVAWVAERKDVLSAFFWMLTLCLYVLYTEKESFRRYLLVLGSFVLALMSKPMVVTLPVILILLDYWPLNRFATKKDNPFVWQVKEKLPLFVLSVVLIAVTIYHPDNSGVIRLPFFSRLANAPVSFMAYLEKTFWPNNLAIFYPFPDQISLWQTAGSILLIAAITAFVVARAKNLPYLLTGWFWFAITIFPVLGILQIGNFTMADRYHYLPSIGLAVMLSWGMPALLQDQNSRRKILFPAAVIFLTAMSLISWKQCGDWRDNFTLWNHALKVTEGNYMAHNNLAAALLEKDDTENAIDHYNQAIGINNYPAAHYNLGVICYRRGQYDQAIVHFNEAIKASPDYAGAFYNLGIVYTVLGQYQRALENYNQALRIMPDHANALNNRALIYLNMGNNIAGCSSALKACKLGNCTTLTWSRNTGYCR